jgi:outer membrane protein OmpA-like peptidoglycan-associated protein
MTRNHLVVALAAVGFAGMIGCGGAAVAVPVPTVPPPPVVVPEVVQVQAPPAPKLATVCDAVIMPGGHLKFPHEVEFDIGKASIKGSANTNAILQCLADFMANNKMVTKFRVEGHTDNAGDATANLKLSQDRADAILAWLTAHTTELNRLEAKGWGPNKPIAPNDSPDHMAMNRRVEFWIAELNGVKATHESIATAMNPPATTAVVTTTAVPAVGVGTVGVAVPTVAVPTVGVAVPTVGVAVPTGVAVGVGVAPAAPKKK